jgi:hypothetical protein
MGNLACYVHSAGKLGGEVSEMSKRHPNVPGLNTNHQMGQDPTPQGHRQTAHRTGYDNSDQDPERQKYENSEPGSDVRQDGVYFYGYKGGRVEADE